METSQFNRPLLMGEKEKNERLPRICFRLYHRSVGSDDLLAVYIPMGNGRIKVNPVKVDLCRFDWW